MNVKAVIVNMVCSIIPGKQRRRTIRNRLRSLISRKMVHIDLSDQNFIKHFPIDDKNILSVLRSLGTFQYIENPGNLGDCLIETATYQFFERYGLMASITSDKACENIVYGGGGPWVKNLYPEACLPAISLFEKAKKIVILPSSVFNCSMLTDVLDTRFVVFCRERKTYDYLKKNNSGAVLYLDYDMALRMDKSVFSFTFLSDDFYVKRVRSIWENIKGIGSVAYFFREDVEKHYDMKTDFDLSAAFAPNMSLDESRFATALMLSVVDMFDVIVTDRLHVGIAAILLNKEVYLFDNIYGKISAVYEHSFLTLKNVHLCRDKKNLKVNLKTHNKTDNFLRLMNALD